MISRNSENAFFIDFIRIWKLTYIFKKIGNDKIRRKVYYFIVNFLNPHLILDVHWLSEPSRIHWHWDKLKGNRSKFIVIQHGVYTGGSISRTFNETYPKTSNFWVWSQYYKEQFSEIFSSKGKFVNIQVFGNTVYNHLDRNEMCYQEIVKVETILIAPTKLDEQQSFWYKKLIRDLLALNKNVILKFHNYQNLEYFADVKHLISNVNISDLLISKSLDMVVSDVSSVLLDTIFFKKAVIYFQPFELENAMNPRWSNIYSEYLNNYFINYRDGQFDLNQILDYINIDAQELVLSKLTSKGTNVIEC